MKKKLLSLILALTLFVSLSGNVVAKASYDWDLYQTTTISGDYGTSHYMSTYFYYTSNMDDIYWKVETDHYGALPYIMYGYSVMQYERTGIVYYTTGRVSAVAYSGHYRSTATLSVDGTLYSARAYCGIDY